MDDYGTLHESNGRYALRFERCFSYTPEEVFRVLTNPNDFSNWYPFATGEMDLRMGGKIGFDDEEGTIYEAIITELTEPYSFGFSEIDDLIDFTLHADEKGCRLIFTHKFSEYSWAVDNAAGWHVCLEVLEQIINGQRITWNDNSASLRKIYSKKFDAEN